MRLLAGQGGLDRASFFFEKRLPVRVRVRARARVRVRVRVRVRRSLRV